MSVSVSVVIPVYNSEKYLGQCLNSVLGQSLHDIEVICVDDGSTDNSASVIQERMKEDSRLKIVRHGVNKGVGAARNTGVEAAEGEWIYFLDSDDWVDSDYLEVMLREASASGPPAACLTAFAHILPAFQEAWEAHPPYVYPLFQKQVVCTEGLSRKAHLHPHS